MVNRQPFLSMPPEMTMLKNKRTSHPVGLFGVIDGGCGCGYGAATVDAIPLPPLPALSWGVQTVQKEKKK